MISLFRITATIGGLFHKGVVTLAIMLILTPSPPPTSGHHDNWQLDQCGFGSNERRVRGKGRETAMEKGKLTELRLWIEKTLGKKEEGNTEKRETEVAGREK